MSAKKRKLTLQEALSQWERSTLAETLKRAPERQEKFITASSEEVNRLYTPLDLPDFDYLEDLGLPGVYPFTRAIHATAHRGRLWTMRQFAGFGSAEKSNTRYKYLLEQGSGGLSIAFDLPTLMGYDTDAPEALGEFGKCGVAVSSLKDMEILLADIPLAEVSTSMTINSPAAILWAMYIAVAEKQGASQAQLHGTLQNDILKEYTAQKEYISLPSRPCVLSWIPWNTVPKVFPSGTPFPSPGTTFVKPEVLLPRNSPSPLSMGWNMSAGVSPVAWMSTSSPRAFSFFFNAHNDFFEEIAKYRAARRIWAREMRKTFKAKNPLSWLLRFHTQTAGMTLTAQQPEINVVRVAIQALAAVLGGTQSLHTNSMDEALALPSQDAATIALRTQQVIAAESGVANTVDPLGGSYFIEALTNRLEQQARDYFQRIEDLGGVLPAIEQGFFQREIADAAYTYQREIDDHTRTIVAVNDYVDKKPIPIPLLEFDPVGYSRQVDRLKNLRLEHDNGRVGQALDKLRLACQGNQNTMPFLLDAVRAYATLGEIVNVMKAVFGTYTEPTWI